MQGRVNGWYIPLVYILAPNETKKMYEEAFKVVAERVPHCNPQYIITDFKIGAISAAKKKLSAIEETCMLFPSVSKCVASHSAAIQRLQTSYINDPDYAKNVRQLLALAFVPHADIVNRFEQLCQTPFWEENVDQDNGKLQDMLQYFESTYIGSVGRNGKRKPVQFSPEM